MKAEEVLKRYITGERNFRSINLRGQKFKGYNLSGADFSHADIRGANFSHAVLKGTDFSGATAGVEARWLAMWSILYACLIILFAFVSLGAISVLRNDISNEFFEHHSIFLYLTLITLLAYWIRQTIQYGLVQGLKILVSVLIPTGIIATIGSAALTTYESPLVSFTKAYGGALFFGAITTSFTALSFTALGILVKPIVLKTLFFVVLGSAPVGGLIRVLSRNGSSFLIWEPTGMWNWAWIDLCWAIAWISGLVVLGYCFSQQSLKGNKQLILFQQLAVILAGVSGTKFYAADLEEANFSQANLNCTDFRAASLSKIAWIQAQNLNYACVGNSYLQYPQIQELVADRYGKGQNFEQINLEGINLQGANLEDASFMHTNFDHANLQDTNLSRAKLKQTQLDGADLTGATLTGAYIEDWGITGTTILDNVQCDYVFMRVPTQGNPNPIRKPDNLHEIFGEGEFTNFIQPYVDTLDLYHSQDVDPRAISIAFKNLSQNHPESDLEIVAMEKRGNSFNLKVRTAPTSNKSELSAEYFVDYNQIKALPATVRLLLVEKDARIHSLETMIDTALKQPTFNIKGDLAMTENKGINISSGGNIGDISGLIGGDVSGVVNLGTVSGNVTNTINQLPDDVGFEQLNLKELLTQLQQAIEGSNELSDADKVDLLEQVQALAEVKQTEEPAKQAGLVRKAKKMFEATLKSLPDTANIVEACNKLLPVILRVLGIPS